MNNVELLLKHLQEDTKNFLDIMNAESEKMIQRKVFLTDVLEKHGSIEGLFTHLLERGAEKLQITRRQTRGNTSVPVGIGLNFALSPNNEEEQKGLGYSDTTSSTQNNNTMSASLDISQEYVYKTRIQDLEERIFDYKQQLAEEREDKREIKRKLQDCYDQIRELTVDKSTFEKTLQLALKEQKLEARTWYDAENLPNIVEGLKGGASMFGVGVPASGGQLNGSAEKDYDKKDYGFFKKSLFEYLTYPELEEDTCKLLVETAKGAMQDGSTFRVELQELISKHQITLENA